ncbi:Heart- and neural crest derivatives-expressed protein 2 [Papilio machaon]|uniref:Heart-and neural crest derivatives-expressed protein 2 n=1 Tax=Papilio machaon TaxID=76193 RepID=A0A0N1IQ21_PAPMA|nr:Heart- and neural crest derivatives-expressed protein 2 [Papilio machaon]
MSSYGSMSPSDEGFDRYEPPFYCQPTHQGSPMDGGVYWANSNGETHEYDTQDVYHDTNNYIGRGYDASAQDDISLLLPDWEDDELLGRFGGVTGIKDPREKTSACAVTRYEDMQIAGNEPYDTYHHNVMHHGFAPNNPGLDCEMQSLPLRYERPTPSSFVRVVKRRTTANKKERRRTQSINTAFTDLRECIPNVPPDTKLSKMVRKRSQSINTAFSNLRDRIPSVLPDTKMTKIKTLRLATSYISYLLKVLETDGEPAGGFRAELHHTPPRRRTTDPNAQNSALVEKKAKGRTGWPQHVWALELKSEQNLQT